MKKEAISSTIWRKAAIWRKALVALVVTFTVSGCDSSPPASPTSTQDVPISSVVNDIKDRLTSASQDVAEAVGPHAQVIQDLTKDEVSKLFRWEYKIVELSASALPDDVEGQLNALGVANWECFSVVAVQEKLRITCKKRPISAVQYLKHIPGL